jgi:hypothetical protein
MVRTQSSKTSNLRASVEARQRRHLKTAAFISAVAGGVAVLQYMIPHLVKTPMYDSVLTGEQWLRELLSGHPIRFYDNLGVSRHVFRQLVHELQMYAGLQDSRYITKEEQLAIFLRLCRTGGVTRDLQERFQHGPDTISK